MKLSEIKKLIRAKKTTQIFQSDFNESKLIENEFAEIWKYSFVKSDSKAFILNSVLENLESKFNKKLFQN